MSNLKLYDAVRVVPPEAQKEIKGGRLKGKTDINPMWRLKTLTEQFGPCGIGWKYVIEKQWTEAGNGGEISAFCNISLYIKDGDVWSDAIPGTGGSALVAKESSGLYTSDECYKMALTDAISVACKALGVGADVYWGADRTKYDKSAPPLNTKPSAPVGIPILCEQCEKPIGAERLNSGKIVAAEVVAARRREKYGKALCSYCAAELKDGH